jgi:glucosyl-3-phosphoglycerate phosphatase
LEQRFPQIDLVIGSDLERVTATAQPWLERSGEQMRVDTRWREIDVGTWSGLTWPEVQARDPDVYAAWRSGEDVRRGGGETFAEFRVRTAAAMEDLRGSGTVLVFTHGGSVRFAAAAALDLPHMGELMLGPAGNCSITQIELRPGGDILAEYNTRIGAW